MSDAHGPQAAREAPALLQAHGVADRVTIEPGDFFERVPAGGDAYLLSHIIRDSSDAQCLTILGHCRRVLPADGRVLIIETVLPSDGTPRPGKMQDLVMLMFPGGQERTEAEYAELLAQAELRLEPNRSHCVDRQHRRSRPRVSGQAIRQPAER